MSESTVSNAIQAPKSGAIGKNTKTLCWTCARATDGTARKQGASICEWARAYKPIDGWDAILNPVKIEWTLKGRRYRKNIKSYFVKSCPLYVPDATS